MSTPITFRARIGNYIRATEYYFLIIDILIFSVVFCIAYHTWPFVEEYIVLDNTTKLLMTKKVILNPKYSFALTMYEIIFTITITFCSLYFLITPRNMAKHLIQRNINTSKSIEKLAKSTKLPPWPFDKQSFSIIIGELQDRNGKRLPNANNPRGKPRYLTQNLDAMVTGYLVTGGIGSGKTESFAKPVLNQIIQHEREILTKKPDGTELIEYYRWSGLITDEKGDFCNILKDIALKHGRIKDVIEIAPEKATGK